MLARVRCLEWGIPAARKEGPTGSRASNALRSGVSLSCQKDLTSATQEAPSKQEAVDHIRHFDQRPRPTNDPFGGSASDFHRMAEELPCFGHLSIPLC